MKTSNIFQNKNLSFSLYRESVTILNVFYSEMNYVLISESDSCDLSCLINIIGNIINLKSNLNYS